MPRKQCNGFQKWGKDRCICAEAPKLASVKQKEKKIEKKHTDVSAKVSEASVKDEVEGGCAVVCHDIGDKGIGHWWALRQAGHYVLIFDSTAGDFVLHVPLATWTNACANGMNLTFFELLQVPAGSSIPTGPAYLLEGHGRDECSPAKVR